MINRAVKGFGNALLDVSYYDISKKMWVINIKEKCTLSRVRQLNSDKMVISYIDVKHNQSSYNYLYII